jgi:molybdenum cofactor cytidylyltransferase
MGIAAIVLAAGSGSRMGADKLSLRLGSRTILGHSLMAYEDNDLMQRILVVRPDLPLPPEAEGWQIVLNEAPGRGMGSSLRAGVTAVEPGCTAFLLGLGDLPALRRQTVAKVIEFGRSSAASMAYPVWQGRRGHPVWLQARYRPALLAARGDEGARALLRQGTGMALGVTDPGTVLDVDTPTDLAQLIQRDDVPHWCVATPPEPGPSCP